jgi:hypothetical protein
MRRYQNSQHLYGILTAEVRAVPDNRKRRYVPQFVDAHTRRCLNHYPRTMSKLSIGELNVTNNGSHNARLMAGLCATVR